MGQSKQGEVVLELPEPVERRGAGRPAHRWAVFVDAGYLYAAAGELVHATSRRRELRIDAPALVAALLERAAATVPGERLRLYWFDAARDRVPTVEHRELARLSHVKVRLGNLTRAGVQKGVDAQLRSDMVALATAGAITDAVLLSGDEDMVPAVEEAQAHGVLVHLWGIEPPYGSNQSERLVWEADTVHVLDRAALQRYVHLAPGAVPATAEPDPGPDPAGPPGQDVAPTPVAVTTTAPPPPATPAPAVVEPAGATGAISEAVGRPSPATLAQIARRPAPAPVYPGLTYEVAFDVGEHVAARWLLTRGRENLADLLPGPTLPASIDRELLIEVERDLQTSLRQDHQARVWVREGFWDRLTREFTHTPTPR